MVSVIYRARFDGKVKPDPAEVEEVMTLRKGELTNLVEDEGELLAPWARQLLRWHLKLSSAVEEIS
jgi:isopentenyldiphosphate isomerase